jgi:hypothetical protein
MGTRVANHRVVTLRTAAFQHEGSGLGLESYVMDLPCKQPVAGESKFVVVAGTFVTSHCSVTYVDAMA